MARKKKEVIKTEETLKPSSREVSQRIIELSETEKFVEVIVIDAPTYTYDYKDYADTYKTTTKEFQKFVATGDFRISCAVTQEQITRLKEDWNIDVYAMVQNALINEASYGMIKHLMSRMGELARKNYLNDYTRLDKLKIKAYNFANKFHTKKNSLGYVSTIEYKKKTKVKSHRDLLKLILRESNTIDRNGKWGYGNFAVCSIKTATILQQHSQYIMFPQEETVSNPGKPYPIGQIAGVTIYVDPFMLYADTNIYIGVKTKTGLPGIKIFVYANGLETKVETEGLGAPKIVYKMRYAMVDVGESCKHLYRKIEYEEESLNSLL